MSLLEQDTTRKRQVEDNVMQLEFEVGDDPEYKVKAIRNSAVYARKLEAEHLLGLYYLISWKSYSKEENTWEPALAVQHFWKLVMTLHAGYLDKPSVISSLVNAVPPMAKPTIKPIKQKHCQTA